MISIIGSKVNRFNYDILNFFDERKFVILVNKNVK